MTNRKWAPHTLAIKKLIFKKIHENREIFRGKCLDVGCGDNPHEELLNPKEYIGIDANINSKADIIGDAIFLPFKDNCFDSIISVQVLQYVRDHQKAINEMNRVLKEDGILFLIIPNTCKEDPLNPDYHRFTREGVKLILNKAHLKLEKLEPIGGVFLSMGYELSFFLHDRVIYRSKIIRYALAPFLIILQYISIVFDFFDTEKLKTVHLLVIAKKTGRI